MAHLRDDVDDWCTTVRFLGVKGRDCSGTKEISDAFMIGWLAGQLGWSVDHATKTCISFGNFHRDGSEGHLLVDADEVEYPARTPISKTADYRLKVIPHSCRKACRSRGGHLSR